MSRRSEAVAQRRTFELPFSLGCVQWQPNAAERQAAWRLYLELNHLPGALGRVEHAPTEEIPPKLVLTPFVEIGRATHRVLAKAGAPVGMRPTSFGQIALRVHSRGFRPFVERWGTRLLVHEATRPMGMSASTHQMLWPERRNFTAEAHGCNAQLRRYVRILGSMAGVRSTAATPRAASR